MRVRLTIHRGTTSKAIKTVEADAAYPPRVGHRFRVVLDDDRRVSTGAVTRVALNGYFHAYPVDTQ